MNANRYFVFAVVVLLAAALSGCSAGSGSHSADDQDSVSSESVSSESVSSAGAANSEEGDSQAGEARADSDGTANSEEGHSQADTPRSDSDEGDAARREAAEKFAFALHANRRIVDGKCESYRPIEEVVDEYVAADSELKDWKAGQDMEYDNSILLKGGSPMIASSAEVVDVQGGAYYVAVEYGIVQNPDPLELIPESAELVVLFNEDDKIEHAWYSNIARDGWSVLHGDRDAYAAFGGKVKELVARYGAPGISTSSENAELTYVSGLAYAELADFGDGNPRLVVCYLDSDNCKQPSSPGANPEDYRVEVWQYADADQGLELVYSDTAQLEGQNSYCGAIDYIEHDGRKYLETWSGNRDAQEGSVVFCAYGVGEDGDFGLVTELAATYDSQSKEYTLNGQPVTESEGQALMKEWFGSDNLKSIGLSSLLFNGFEPKGVVSDANAVIAVLEACAG